MIKRTRPYPPPQTNGKIERFNRTLLDEWAYAKPYLSEQERRDAYPRLAPYLQPSPDAHRAEGAATSERRATSSSMRWWPGVSWCGPARHHRSPPAGGRSGSTTPAVLGGPG